MTTDSIHVGTWFWAIVVWREKTQFDEGSGTVDLLAEAIGHWIPSEEARRYARDHAIARLRSPEECLYHKLLCEAYTDPGPILANVARWADVSSKSPV